MATYFRWNQVRKNDQFSSKARRVSYSQCLKQQVKLRCNHHVWTELKTTNQPRWKPLVNYWEVQSADVALEAKRLNQRKRVRHDAYHLLCWDADCIKGGSLQHEHATVYIVFLDTWGQQRIIIIGQGIDQRLARFRADSATQREYGRRRPWDR